MGDAKRDVQFVDCTSKVDITVNIKQTENGNTTVRAGGINGATPTIMSIYTLQIVVMRETWMYSCKADLHGRWLEVYREMRVLM